METEDLAAVGGTRQMMHDDELAALTNLLIESGAVPKALMIASLETLIQKLILKARGQLETSYALYPCEVFERVRELSAQVASLRAPKRK